MNAIVDTKDVACISWVPKGCVVAKMSLRREEEFESNIRRAWRICDQGMWLIMFFNF